MRLLSLHLTRYGPFADHHITLDAAPRRVNLLYAPNGAGKSVLRQAFGDLLFGIPGQSPMGFRFGYTGMRIAAEAIAPDGSRFGFSRRKGMGNTLLDREGQADTSGRLAGLLGSTDRSLLERLFALDTERLRDGGTALLESGGAVADALLAAGGLRGAKALRQALEASADALAPSKRVAQKPYYRALDSLQDARKRAGAAVLRPDDWFRLERALADAEADRLRHNAEAADLSRQINLLQRLRRVRAPMAAREAAAEWLAAHPDAPVLAASLDKRLADAAQKNAIAVQQREQAVARHAEFVKEADAIRLDQPVLDAAEAIERLGEQAGAVGKALVDIPQRQAERGAILARIAAQLRRLNSDMPPERAGTLIPHRAAETRARDLIARHGAVAAAFDQAPFAVDEAARDITDAEAALAPLPAGQATDALAALVAEIRGDGDPRARADEAARATEASRANLAAAIAAVPGWAGETADLVGLDILPLETYERLDQARRHEAGELAGLSARAKDAANRAEQATRRLDAIAGGGIVADEAAVLQARAHRDRGWQLIYRLAFTADGPTPAESASFAVEQPLPLAYQSAVQVTDDLADRRVLQADFIAQVGEARRTLSEAQQNAAQLAAACIPASERAMAAEHEWRQACQNLPLREAAGFAEVRGFLLARGQMIERRRDLDRDAQAQARVVARHAGWTARLTEALAPTSVPTLDGLLVEAEARRAAATRMAQQRIALEARLRELHRRHDAANVVRTQSEARMAAWTAEWATALAQLGRPIGEPPGVTADILAALTELDQELKEATRLDERVTAMTADNRAFTAQVANLVETTSPDRAGVEAGETVICLAALRSLRERLAAQRVLVARRAELQKFIDQTAAQVLLMGQRLTQSQAELDHLLSVIGADTIEAAEQRLLASRERASQLAALAQADARLREEGEGLTLDALRSELMAVPADEVASRLAAAETAMQAANAAAQGAVAAATEKRGEMAQAAGDISYETAMADQQAAIAAADRVLVEALLARLAALMLERAMAAVEAQSGSALLARIASYFQTLTAGAFQKIVTDDDGAGGLDLVLVPADEPLLVKKVSQLSEGSRDQLFLALRLAAIEDHAATAPPLPFIGDDILQTSDDARTVAALQALLDLSQHVQVILLTHHAHIVQLAGTLPADTVHFCQIAEAAPSAAAQ